MATFVLIFFFLLELLQLGDDIVSGIGGTFAPALPDLFPRLCAGLLELGVGQTLFDKVLDACGIVYRKTHADLGEHRKRPGLFLQEVVVILTLVELDVCIYDGLVEDECEVQHDAREVGDHDIGPSQNFEVVIVPVPLEVLAVRELRHETVDDVLIRGKRLRVRPYDDVVACIEKILYHRLAVSYEKAGYAPRRCKKDRCLVRLRCGACSLDALHHLVHIGDADDPQFLLGKSAELLEFSYLIDLHLAREEYRIKIVELEHPVGCRISRSVHYVHIVINGSRALPLENVESRGGAEHQCGIEHVEPCEGLVALADEFSPDVLVFLGQRRIIRRRCHEYGVHSSCFKFVADGFECIPVTLRIRIDDKRDPVLVRFPSCA